MIEQKQLHKPKVRLSQYELDALARAMLPAIVKFFQTPEGQAEFDEWKKARDKKLRIKAENV